MKILTHNGPHIRSSESSATMLGDCVIALIPLVIMACFYYGTRPLLLIGISVATSLVADIACTLLAKKKFRKTDLSAVVTGMILALMLPASAHLLAPVFGSLFAIVVAKHIFGGFGNNIFNPAACGFAFLAVAFPANLFRYPIPFSHMDGVGTFFNLTNGPAATLRMDALPQIDPMQMLLGNFPGPMGATSILILVVCALFLVIRHAIDWQVPAVFLATCAAFAALFPRVPTGSLDAVMYELMSGLLLFGAVFLITDPVTSPISISGKVLFAFTCGILTMLFRYFGGQEVGVFFAVLIANPFTHAMDRWMLWISKRIRRLSLEYKRRKNERAQTPGA